MRKSRFNEEQIIAILKEFNRVLRNGGRMVLFWPPVYGLATRFLKSADWVIDLGPEGGEAGGKIVAQGTPEEVAGNLHSHTGKWLSRVL